jgi:uncharacterized protein (DUF1697 family)
VTTKKSTGRHVALLRGINVGGKNKLPMKQLVALFETAGCSDVRSYIQSGNVVFTADAALARRIASHIAAAIHDRHGLTVPVVMRSAEELQAVASGNPFLGAGVDPKQLHVGFLAEEPSRSAIAALDPDRSPPDRFELRGRELYLHCPNGMARTKLTNAYFDAKLATTSTMRNWRTVLKVREMLSA